MARYLPWLGLAVVSGVSFFLIKNLDRSGTRSGKNYIRSLLAKTKNDVDRQKQPLVSSGSELESHVDEQKPLVSSVETEKSDMVGEQQPLVSSKTEKVDKRRALISLFLEVVPGQSERIAKQYLQATSWDLEQAVGLFYSSQDVRRETNVWAEMERSNVRAADNWVKMERPNVRAADNSELDTLYRPPKELICKQRSFHAVKEVVIQQGKWLIVNVQSEREFSSKTLNLDTWGNEAISQTIAANFIFWQVYDDDSEGKKVCTFYKLTSFPAILILNPDTGEKKKLWTGMKEAWELLEDLVPFMDAGPEITKMDEKVLPASPEEPSTSSSKKLAYPDLPEEPKVDKALLCRVGVRLPDGRKLQRSFLKTDPIQLLWSFCSSQLDEAEKSRSLLLTQAVPGASKTLNYDSKQTFEESGLSNSMVSVTLD